MWYDLAVRLLLGLLALVAAVLVWRFGVPWTQNTRRFIAVGLFLSAAFWFALAICDPAPHTLNPWWVAWSRVPNLFVPAGIIAISLYWRDHPRGY